MCLTYVRPILECAAAARSSYLIKPKTKREKVQRYVSCPRAETHQSRRNINSVNPHVTGGKKELREDMTTAYKILKRQYRAENRLFGIGNVVHLDTDAFELRGSNMIC